MIKGSLLTIEIREEFIKIAEISKKKGQLFIHNLIQIPALEEVVKDGEILNTERLANHIRYFLGDEKYKNKKAIFTIHSSKIAQKEAAFPSLKKRLFNEMLRENAQDYFPMAIENYSVRYQILEERVVEDKKEIRVSLLAAPLSLLEGYAAVCKKLQLRLVALDYNGNSTQQLIRTFLKDEVSVVLHLEEETTNLMIMEGKTLLFQRDVPYGKTSLAYEEVQPLSESEMDKLYEKLKI